jgi:O-antigen/teichoic acid export membrane protein
MLLFYTRVLAPADYGIIDILNVLTTLLNFIIALEISQGVAIYYSEAKTDSERVAYASAALWFTVITNSLFLIVALALSKPLSLLVLGADNLQSVFQAAALYMYGNGIFYLLQNQLRWQLKPKLYAVSGIVFSLVSAATTTILLFYFNSGVIGVFYGLFAGEILAITVACYFLRASYKLIFDLQKCLQMLAFSTPLVVSSISIWVFLSIDRIAINKLMTLTDVGLYGVGYRLASIVSLFLTGFYGALTPIIFNNYEKPNTPKELAKIFRYFLALILPLLVALSVFSPEIIIVSANADYYPASQVIPLLAPAIVLSNMFIFAPGLELAKKTAQIATINLIAALINTILNFILIPYIGIAGAALATLVTTLVTFSSYMIASQKLYYIPHEWRRIITVTLISVSFGFIGFYLEELIKLPITFVVPVKCLLMIVCIALLSWLLLGIHEIRTLTKIITFRKKP